MTRKLTALMVMVLLAGAASAGTFDVTADSNDRTWRDDGSAIWAGQPSAGIGYDGSLRETTHILPFALPDIGAETITSANLLIGATDSAYGAVLSIDLYGVRVNASSVTEFSDFYAGAWDPSGTNGAAIQQAYATKASSGDPAVSNPRLINSSAEGNTSLAAYLNSLYAGGAQAGEFVFLRLNVDQDYIAGSNSYLYMYTANSTAYTNITGGTAEIFQLPTLQITTGAAPEPAAMGMLALGGLALIRKRRKA